jgi:hypothetical protein
MVSDSRQRQEIFVYSRTSRSALGPIQPSIRGASRSLSPEVKWPVWNLLLTSVQYRGQEWWSYYMSTLLYDFMRLRYEPNRLMLSIGLWRWYINITITILDTGLSWVEFILRPTVSWPVRLCIGLPFWCLWPEFNLILSLVTTVLLFFL